MTNAELAILGLILEHPRHGYEIERVIEARGMRDWTDVGFSSIYYNLKKMEKKGWIQAFLDQGSGPGPARKVYQITNEGHQAWREATLNALALPLEKRSSFLLGLVGVPALEGSEVIIALGQYHETLATRRDQVVKAWQGAGDSLPLFLEGIFDYSITLLDAELNWVQTFIRKLAS